jgi:fatty acid desaturase
MLTLFRHEKGSLPNLLAICYTFAGWGAGVWLMTRPEWALNAAGVLLTAHALVYSGYLIHECEHSAIFTAGRANDRLGTVLCWLNGACLASYAGLKEKHLRHHADRLDVVTFDYRAVLSRAPKPVLWVVLALEWAYVPAVELLMRVLIIAAPFIDGTPESRPRMMGIATARLALLGGLALISVKAVVLYALAYLIFLNVLRFMDAFQHTYDVFPTRSLERAPADPKRSRQYEQENTYSNLISVGAPWLNLLTMNFAYHNAHHARPVAPWYQLPALHGSLFGEANRQVIPCSALIRNYHKHRVERVMATDYGTVAAEGNRANGFIGAVGVSFLTAV